MRRTLAQRMLRALLARGYEHRTNERGGKYVELVPSRPVDQLTRVMEGIGVEDDTVVRMVVPVTGILFTGHHRLLVGSSGALRVTTGAIADGRPVSDEVKAMLVQEGSR